MCNICQDLWNVRTFESTNLQGSKVRNFARISRIPEILNLQSPRVLRFESFLAFIELDKLEIYKSPKFQTLTFQGS